MIEDNPLDESPALPLKAYEITEFGYDKEGAPEITLRFTDIGLMNMARLAATAVVGATVSGDDRMTKTASDLAQVFAYVAALMEEPGIWKEVVATRKQLHNEAQTLEDLEEVFNNE